MTTQHAFPKNKVILYGVVDRRFDYQEDKKKKEDAPAIRRFRNPIGGADYTVSLQVAAPYGGGYKIEVDVGQVAGAEVLEHCKAGQGLVLTGYLTRTREVDRRFGAYEDAMVEGIIYRDVVFEVDAVRERGEDDPQGTGTNVALEGEVVEPPIFMRHPDYADIELARVGIQCRTKPIIDHNGYLIPSRPCTVTVVIPTDDEAAELLYRRGNRVQLRGVIERMAVRQMANKLVRERLDDLQEDWESRREQLKGGEVFGDKERKELKREGANVMRKMDRFSRIARTAVLAIEVTPLPGATTIDRATAADDRTAYDLEQREAAKQRRAEQRERRARNKSHEQAARTAAAAAQDDHEAGAVDAPMGVTPIAEPLAHRRRKPVVAEVKDGADMSVPDTELGELAESAMPHSDLVEA